MIVHGRDLIIMQNGVAIAAAKSCSINVECDTIPVSSPSDGQWEHSIPGRKSWSISVSTLVTRLVNAVAKVGTTVTLRVKIGGGAGLPFNGFVDDVTIETQGLGVRPDAIVWDTTNCMFLAKRGLFNPKYYITWSDGDAYMHPSDGDFFSYLGQTYLWESDGLTNEALQGSAIVTAWKATGSVGNLAQGSFSFKGTGGLVAQSM